MHARWIFLHYFVAKNIFKLVVKTSKMVLSTCVTRSGDFWTLGNFLKPLQQFICPNLPTFLDNFCKGVKIYHFFSKIIFLVKSFLGNFYRHLAIFIWSHCSLPTESQQAIIASNWSIVGIPIVPV